MAKMNFKDEEVGNPDIKSFKELGGSWLSYKRYLASKGALAPGLSLSGTEEQPKKKDHPRPWHNKKWSEFTNEDKANLARHFVNLGQQKASNYRLFLINHADAPKSIFDELGVSFK